jgi:hypothetical protein
VHQTLPFSRGAVALAGTLRDGTAAAAGLRTADYETLGRARVKDESERFVPKLIPTRLNKKELSKKKLKAT